MRHDGTKDLFGYWNRLRGTYPAPRRTDIKPAEISSRLADTFILQATDGAGPLFRLAGTRLCSIYGRELKSEPFLSLWHESDQTLTRRMMTSVLDDAAVAVAIFEGISSNGRKHPFELLLLPLAGEGSDRRILGSIVAIGNQYWLGAHPIVANALTSLRIIDPNRDVQTKAVVGAETPLRSAPGAYLPHRDTPAAQPTGFRRVGHLNVYQGGKIIN